MFHKPLYCSRTIRPWPFFSNILPAIFSTIWLSEYPSLTHCHRMNFMNLGDRWRWQSTRWLQEHLQADCFEFSGNFVAGGVLAKQWFIDLIGRGRSLWDDGTSESAWHRRDIAVSDQDIQHLDLEVKNRIFSRKTIKRKYSWSQMAWESIRNLSGGCIYLILVEDVCPMNVDSQDLGQWFFTINDLWARSDDIGHNC